MLAFEVFRRAIIVTYQFPAAKKMFTWGRGHLCNAASQPVQDGVQTLKSSGIAENPREWPD